MTGKATRARQRLRQPSGKVIRRRAEKLLKRTDAAVRRLQDPDDKEALHDSRVALRRLRGWFQAFRKQLAPKPKQRRALKRLAHSTNAARDAEVGLEWLGRKREHEAGADAVRFASALKTLRKRSYGTVRRDLPPAWHRLSRKLGRAAADVSPSHHRFRHAFAASVAAYAEDFERTRADARTSPTPSKIHALRIAEKKLRYLTETALGATPATEAFLREMNALHDSAGAIQDLQRLQELSAEAARNAGLASDKESYLEVGAAARREQLRRIAGFRKAYLGRAQPACLRELHQLIRRLEH
ncbi:MAG TPA: CHAD domain-containing protein [Gammaproteobacteria bacterium]|nr:CHAD domain-containing protein [Gammaproteobacteria bacterium]